MSKLIEGNRILGCFFINNLLQNLALKLLFLATRPVGIRAILEQGGCRTERPSTSAKTHHIVDSSYCRHHRGWEAPRNTEEVKSLRVWAEIPKSRMVRLAYHPNMHWGFLHSITCCHYFPSQIQHCIVTEEMDFWILGSPHGWNIIKTSFPSCCYS